MQARTTTTGLPQHKNATTECTVTVIQDRAQENAIRGGLRRLDDFLPRMVNQI